MRRQTSVFSLMYTMGGSDGWLLGQAQMSAASPSGCPPCCEDDSANPTNGEAVAQAESVALYGWRDRPSYELPKFPIRSSGLHTGSFWTALFHDAELTHEGLALHRCVEGNINPGAESIARGDLP